MSRAPCVTERTVGAAAPPALPHGMPVVPHDRGGQVGRVAGFAAAVGTTHLAVYAAVTRLTPLRPPEAFIDPATVIDQWIPHLPWTWPLYWLPYVLVPLLGGSAVLHRPRAERRQLTAVWMGMIVVGGLVQLAIPAVAPWPQDPALSQRLYHDSALIMPYATLPSMHVAHVAFAVFACGSRGASRLAPWWGAFLVLLVAGSTLTLKEHLFLDTLAGLALAAAAFLALRLRPA
jgi:hypothetical protein